MSKTIKLQLGELTAEIATLGAELQSLKKGDTEYIWQGDPTYWSGRSPVLFPITGRVWQNHYRHEGQTYELGIHGFARTMEFAVVEQTKSKVTMGIKADDNTAVNYPFNFFLFITYELSGSSLSVTWFVRNEGADTMHFQIGAHPALNLPAFDAEQKVHGYLGFEADEEMHYLIPVEGGCVKPDEPHAMPLDAERTLPLTASTFDIDTYVIDAAKVHSCTLFTAERVPHVSVEFSMPILALWAPTIKHPDCPFVCIEPWCGSCDTVGYDGEFAQRRIMQHLEPGEHFLNTYKIRIA
jgi:galactose mutarotase-like enzyme